MNANEKLKALEMLEQLGEISYFLEGVAQENDKNPLIRNFASIEKIIFRAVKKSL
jgi:hypothetical protein